MPPDFVVRKRRKPVDAVKMVSEYMEDGEYYKIELKYCSKFY
jgi:hypothetical protein